MEVIVTVVLSCMSSTFVTDFLFEVSQCINLRKLFWPTITTDPVFTAGGKPSTWYPLGELVEQIVKRIEIE